MSLSSKVIAFDSQDSSFHSKKKVRFDIKPGKSEPTIKKPEKKSSISRLIQIQVDQILCHYKFSKAPFYMEAITRNIMLCELLKQHIQANNPGLSEIEAIAELLGKQVALYNFIENSLSKAS